MQVSAIREQRDSNDKEKSNDAWSRRIYDIDNWKKCYASKGRGPLKDAMREVFRLVEAGEICEGPKEPTTKKQRRKDTRRSLYHWYRRVEEIDPKKRELFVVQKSTKTSSELMRRVSKEEDQRVMEACIDVNTFVEVNMHENKCMYANGVYEEEDGVQAETLLFAVRPKIDCQ